MNLRPIGIVFRKELIDSLRDRRTLLSMIVVPVFLMPLLLLGMASITTKTVRKVQQQIPTVMILGGQDSPKLVAGLKALKTISFIGSGADFTNRISEKQIQAAIDVPLGFDAALARGESTAVAIYLYEGEMRSMFAAERLDQFFRSWHDSTLRERLAVRNLPENLFKPFHVERKNVAPPKKVVGNLFGGLFPYMVIILCLVGAMYPAMDLTAGEKERGTIETILCSPVSRTHLVLGKFFMVLLAAVASAALALASLGFSFVLAKKVLAGLSAEAELRLPLALALEDVVAVFVMVLPVAVFFSAAQLAIALFAKSFKEAQTYLTPLMFVVILPAVAAMAPGMELNAQLALVPILNTSLVSKEIMSGTYHWNYISLIFLSSSIYAAVALAVAVKLFQREEVLFRT